MLMVPVCQWSCSSRTSVDQGQDLPVGVFEADASLLELISIFQFGHILGVNGWFSHGFLEKRTQLSPAAWADWPTGGVPPTETQHQQVLCRPLSLHCGLKQRGHVRRQTELKVENQLSSLLPARFH